MSISGDLLINAITFNRSRRYSNELWRSIQAAVGAEVDGVPGRETAKAVFRFQRKWGLRKVDADGQVGRTTLAMLGLGGGVFKSLDLADLAAQHPRLLFGVDVSTYQGAPAWLETASGEAGVGFVIARALKGSLKRDKQWSRNQAELGALSRAYCGYCPVRLAHYKPEEAVDKLVEAGAAGNWGRLAIDLEYKRVHEADEQDFGLDAKWTLEACQIARKATGKRPLLYLSHRSAKLIGADTMAELRDLARLWWVAYQLPKDLQPRTWGVGDHWDIWQFTCVGHVRGIEGCVDLNVINPTSDLDLPLPF